VGAKPASSLVSHVLPGAYNLYCLFVSESIAPWVWGLSLSVAAAIAISLAIVCFCGPRPALRYAAFFLFVLAIMSAIGIVTTKRIMLIAPWLLLRLALPSHLGAGKSESFEKRPPAPSDELKRPPQGGGTGAGTVDLVPVSLACCVSSGSSVGVASVSLAFRSSQGLDAALC